MNARLLLPVSLLVAALLSGVAPSLALAVTGTLGPQYGSPLAVQTTQGNAGALQQGSQIDLALASRLDMAYGYVSNGVLYLFFTGNLTFYWSVEGQTVWLPLDVFIDCAPGGQHQLLSNNPNFNPVYNLNQMSGLTFDTGFDADYWLSLGGNGGTWPNLQAYFAALPAAGGGTGAFLGSTLTGPPGVLSGGTNPYGIEVTLNDANNTDQGYGCGPAIAPAVPTGVEWAIPLAAIGNPTGCVRVCAFVSCGDHSCISNQVLGPIPPGTCSFVPTSGVDFSAIPGDQFFTICAPTPAHPTSWGRLKTLYR